MIFLSAGGGKDTRRYLQLEILIGGHLASRRHAYAHGGQEPQLEAQETTIFETHVILCVTNSYAERWRSAFAELAGHDAACIVSLVALRI